mmetsp:Transcript_27346/g.72626  ORF Transcript_27346/g.72626 Transcript_27346/m.72626 type:complete len:91 (-) Transcript_27346:221-493(-)
MSVASWDLQFRRRTLLNAVLVLLVLCAQALAQGGSEEEGKADKADAGGRITMMRLGRLAGILLAVCAVGGCCCAGGFYFWRRRQQAGAGQ